MPIEPFVARDGIDQDADANGREESEASEAWATRTKAADRASPGHLVARGRIVLPGGGAAMDESRRHAAAMDQLRRHADADVRQFCAALIGIIGGVILGIVWSLMRALFP